MAFEHTFRGLDISILASGCAASTTRSAVPMTRARRGPRDQRRAERRRTGGVELVGERRVASGVGDRGRAAIVTASTVVPTEHAAGTLIARVSAMKRAWLTIVAVLAACDSQPSPAPTSMPWLHGFRVAAVSDVPTLANAQRISDLLQATDHDDYGGLEVRADLAGDAEPETVLASFTHGVVVTNAAGRVLAGAPGFIAEGSADDLLSLAVGDAQLAAPVVLLAVQTGGHRENTVTLAVYQMRGDGTLQQLFSAPIEVHRGDQTSAGEVTFLPPGLLYQAPDARFATVWMFNAKLGRYVERAAQRTAGALRTSH